MVLRNTIMANKELNEKIHDVSRMNKTRAYKELQRRQAKYTRAWLDSTPMTTQSFDTSSIYRRMKPESNNKIIKISSTLNHGRTTSNMISRQAGYPSPYTQNTNSYIFTIPDRAEGRQLSRVRHFKSRQIQDPNRPVTAPEMIAFSTLDGPRIETIREAYSVKSHNSDPDETTLRQTVSKTRLSNTKGPLSTATGTIQYPLASKMREILANDGALIPPQKEIPACLAKRDSNSSLITSRSQTQIKLNSKITNTSQQISHNSHPSLGMFKGGSTTALKRPPHKQVSFQQDGLKPSVVLDKNGKLTDENDTPLSLTAKNLELLNSMVLKTMRTSKFDERIVNWVRERQCDKKSFQNLHEPVPESEPHIAQKLNHREDKSQTPADNTREDNSHTHKPGEDNSKLPDSQAELTERVREGSGKSHCSHASAHHKDSDSNKKDTGPVVS